MTHYHLLVIFLLLFQHQARLVAHVDTMEAAAKDLIQKLQEEIPEDEREARKAGNY